MATRTVWNKGGLKLVCDVSDMPAPRPKQVFALPDLSAAGHPFVTLSLYTDPDIGPRAVVMQVDSTLPETTGTWMLHWTAGTTGQGSYPVIAGTRFQDGDMVQQVTYAVHLEHTSSAGKVTRYPDAVIVTPRNLRLPPPEELHDAVTAALAAAASAQAAADGKIESFYQATAPATASEGDIWFDTDDGNKIYTRRSGMWVATQDSAIAAAISAAATAQGTADGKARIYYQAAQPAGLGAADQGDLWVDTDDHLKVWAWSGSAWVLAQDWYTANAAANAAATIIANASLDTKITNLERPALRNLRASLAASVTSAKAKAQAMVPVVPQTALDTAWTTFTTNVDPILALTTDSTIVKATFDGWWSAVYSALADLQGAMAAQANTTANTALAATIAAGSDGVLSRGEKPGVIIDFNGATADHAMLLAKAQSCGVAYADFSSAYGALRDYLESLSPAYTNTAADTPISATTWAARWSAWGSAYTSMLVRIASAAPSTVEVIATANANLTTNAAAPVLDGVTMVAGKIVMLPAQTTKSQNGVYQVTYAPPAGAAYNVFPTAGGTTGNGSYSNNANAYDNSAGVPNDATAATLTSGDYENDYGEVVYSGFSGSNLSGTLTIKIAPTCEQNAELGGNAIVNVATSTDGGQSFVSRGTYSGTQSMQTISVPVEGVSGSDIRVRVRAQTAVEYDFDQYYELVPIRILKASAAIHSVYLAVPASGSANWSFKKQSDIPNASTWRTRAGTTYPPGSHYLATVASDLGVGISSLEAPYEAPLGKPSGGSAFLRRSSAGANTWEARRFGFPDYASGATRAVTTVYQAAEDGWLNLVLEGDFMNDLGVYVGATNNPTNLIWRQGDNINNNTKYNSAMIPIPAGTYYKLQNGTYGYERGTYRWFPSLV